MALPRYKRAEYKNCPCYHGGTRPRPRRRIPIHVHQGASDRGAKQHAKRHDRKRHAEASTDELWRLGGQAGEDRGLEGKEGPCQEAVEAHRDY